jgi:hypothetical protein
MKPRSHLWPEKNRGWLTAQPVRRVKLTGYEECRGTHKSCKSVGLTHRQDEALIPLEEKTRASQERL